MTEAFLLNLSVHNLSNVEAALIRGVRLSNAESYYANLTEGESFTATIGSNFFIVFKATSLSMAGSFAFTVEY